MRYYFHFRHGAVYHADTEGDELEGDAAAREEGRLSARELMSLDHGTPDPRFDGATFEITTSDGTIVGVTQFEERLLEALALPALGAS